MISDHASRVFMYLDDAQDGIVSIHSLQYVTGLSDVLFKWALRDLKRADAIYCDDVNCQLNPEVAIASGKKET